MNVYQKNQPALIALLIIVCGLLAACNPTRSSTNSDPKPRTEDDRAALIKLNQDLVESQIVARDATLFSKLAVDEFKVLAPGGMIESKEQAISGVSAWNANSVKLTGTDVVFHGSVALVFGRMDIDGEMRPVGKWGPLKYMSTWIREGDEWRLVSRSMTPCLDKLVEMGRC